MSAAAALLDGSNLVVAGAALLGAFASGLAGFAFGLVALGLWLHVLAPKVAGPLVVVGSIFVQAVSLFHLRRGIRFDLIWPFVVGGLVGVPIGVWLLDYTDPVLFRRGVGIFLALYSSYMLLIGHPAPTNIGGRAADSGIGFIGGVMTGMAGLSGPIPTAWCALRGWTKDVMRAVFQPFNIVMQIASVVALAQAGLVTRELGFYTLLCLPAMGLGVWLGLRLYARVDEGQFRKIVLGMLLASGISLVI